MSNRISIRPEEILGILKGASTEEISRARARLAKMLHPDLQDKRTTAIMQLINHAAETMLSGEEGSYSFDGNSWEPRRDPGRNKSRTDSRACGHPKKPGYDQCFECSGIRPCICGAGYYRPPNDRCRACRQRAQSWRW